MFLIYGREHERRFLLLERVSPYPGSYRNATVIENDPYPCAHL